MHTRQARSLHALRSRTRIAAIAGVMVTAGCTRSPRSSARKSEPALVMQMMGDARITVRYNRPVARGRVLFGGIVPYGQTWDPGADEATTITVDRPVTFGGAPLAAGSYSVWAIPQPGEWTLILSTKANVYHTPYPERHDALRVHVAPHTAPHMEALAFYFPEADAAHALLALHWGETRIDVPIVPR